MTFGSRQKGSVAEREVAKLCAVWWARIEPGCEFTKTPLSGGWSTPKLRGEFKVAGDLVTTATQWPFTVEVKRREGWAPANLERGRASPVWAWWLQAQKAALEEKRVPMLWLRRSREAWRVMVPQAFATMRLLGPSMTVWNVSALKALNIGLHPICFHAEAWLAHDPELML